MTDTKTIIGTLIYDTNDCPAGVLKTARQALDSAGITYDLRPSIEVYAEEGIAFDFKNRRPSGFFNLSGLAEIVDFAGRTNVKKAA